MSDLAGGEGSSGTAAEAIAAVTGAVGDAGGGDGGAGSRDWLPEPFRADPVLADVKDVGGLAKAFIDTKKMVGDRIARPSADNMAAFYDSIRPADASVYEINGLEGDDNTAFADAFRPVAHQLALQPDQVKGLVDWQNGFVQAQRDAAATAQSEAVKADAAEFDTFKTQWNADNGGTYDAMLGKVGDLTKAVGWDADMLALVNDKTGSAKMLSGLFSLAKGMGNLPLHGDGGQGSGGSGFANLSPEAASSKLDELQGSAEWRGKVDSGDQNAMRERKDLIAAIARKKAA
jgi:hypothetical protein